MQALSSPSAALAPEPAGHLLAMADFPPALIGDVIDVAAAMKSGWAPGTSWAPLAGRAVAVIFEKPSLRTRVSFEVGIARLGGTAVVLHDAEIALGVRES